MPTIQQVPPEKRFVKKIVPQLQDSNPNRKSKIQTISQRQKEKDPRASRFADNKRLKPKQAQKRPIKQPHSPRGSSNLNNETDCGLVGQPTIIETSFEMNQIPGGRPRGNRKSEHNRRHCQTDIRNFTERLV